MTSHAWMPSDHVVTVVGIAVAAILLLSVLVVSRDAWLLTLTAHTRELVRLLLALVVIGVLVFLFQHLDDLERLFSRMRSGDVAWLAAAIGLEVVSFGGYVVLTRSVFSPAAPRLKNVIVSTELTLAGVVATRLFSAGGAGGIAFTGWVLHRAGMAKNEAARRLTAFMILLYSVYLGTLLIGGLLVVLGLFHGVPRLLGLIAFIVGLGAAVIAFLLIRIPGDLERRAREASQGSGGFAKAAAKLSTVPQVAGRGTRMALAVAKDDPWVMTWPVVWWAFDVATLWACFQAFGEPPPLGTLVLCYFLGMMGNLLPVPGGVGGSEGGMVGALVASGVGAELALAAVVSYQVISTYLPAAPGLGAYLDLRRRMKTWGPEVDDDADGQRPSLTKAAASPHAAPAALAADRS